MTMRILVFGATGQLGAELMRLDGRNGMAVTAPVRAEADLADPAACAAVVARTGADVVINAAAYTAVDRAESEETLAGRINAEAPGAMARAAAARGLPFLHVSTDYVFDGSGERPWREDDAPAPINAYGRTKLAGERAVLDAGGAAAVMRLSWLFAGHGANFVRTMLRVGRERPLLKVVDDQIGGPTPAAAAAAALATMARALREGRGETGVFHFAGGPDVSWAGFARAVFEQAGWPDRPAVEPIGSADWPTPARRPLNSRLDCSRIAAAFGVARPDWRTGLDAALREFGEVS